MGYILNALLDRISLAKSFGGTRNLQTALGYPSEISYNDYVSRYRRQDIAAAVIDRPILGSWDGEITIKAFEKWWAEAQQTLKIKKNLMILDRLMGLGKYAVLYIGLDDVDNSSKLKTPATGKKIVFIRPFSESSARIESLNKNTKSERYGQPEYYRIDFEDSGSVLVHHTRVIHVFDSKIGTNNEGEPRLEVVWNRLMDLEKIVGGDSEMFWRNARPGYSGNVKEDYVITPDARENIKQEIQDYENDLTRILINEGVDLKALSTKVFDPTPHVDVQIQMISTTTGIPKRILTGSEKGELASTQDLANWLSFLKKRREQIIEPLILRPFIKRCQEMKIVGGDDFEIIFSDLFSTSLAQKVDIGNKRAIAIKAYMDSPGVENIVPPESFLKFNLAYSDSEIEQMKEEQKTMIS